MQGKRPLTQAEIEQRREARWQHGLRSQFAETGDETTLTDPQRSRLAELRAELATPDGVIDALREHTAKMCMIFEWAVSWLQDKAEREGAVSAFESKMLQRFFTAAAEARRALETLARVQGKGGKGDLGEDIRRIVEAQAQRAEHKEQADDDAT